MNGACGGTHICCRIFKPFAGPAFANVLLYVGFFTSTVIMGQLGVFGMSQAHLIEMYILVFLLACLAFYMHRSNISRLLHHNERKTYLFKKNKMDAETNANATKAK